MTAFASSSGWKTLLDGSFNRFKRPVCPRGSKHYEQIILCRIPFERFHIGLHDKLKSIVLSALLLEYAGNGGEKSCGLLAELREAFTVFFEALSPKSSM
jgi:hypothetical protein